MEGLRRWPARPKARRPRDTMTPMNTPQDSSLGREVSYPSQYDPGLLFPIPRSGARADPPRHPTECTLLTLTLI